MSESEGETAAEAESVEEEAAALASPRKSADVPLLDDDELDSALESFTDEADPAQLEELLKTMNENNIIAWDEAERILSYGEKGVVKSGLPEQVRPNDDENDTDIGDCTAKAVANDPSLTKVNLNNMKRTPIPNIQRLVSALADNAHLEELSLANLALTDAALEPLLAALESNTALRKLNVETNLLTGEFLARLFKAMLAQQTLAEVRAANQGTTFSSPSEMDIMRAVIVNEGLCKIGITLRNQEARIKVDQAIFRNCEIRRLARLKQN